MWSLLFWPAVIFIALCVVVLVGIFVTLAVAGQDFSNQPHHLPCPDCKRRMPRGSETCPHCGSRFV